MQINLIKLFPSKLKIRENLMENLLEKGIAAYREKQYDVAKSFFASAIKQNQNDERLWGWMHNVCKNDKERVYCLEQILRINPKNEKIRQMLITLKENDLSFEKPEKNREPVQEQKKDSISNKEIRTSVESPLKDNAMLPGPLSQNGQPVLSESNPNFLPIAGFWRRFFAWIVDMIIIGIGGQIIGIAFSSILFGIGPYGRAVGLLVFLAYFGVMNSEIGGGQTLGKRLMKVAVRNKNGEPIELWRSIARTLLLVSPILFSNLIIAVFFSVLQAIVFQGWVFPAGPNIIGNWLVFLLVFGLGGAILYTMIFNSKSRQGFHDLIGGTYVVYLQGKPISSFPKTSRIHWVVTSLWIGIITIASLPIIAPSIISKPPLASAVNPAFAVLLEDPRFFTVSLHYNFGREGNIFEISVWHKGKIDDSEAQEVANSIVKTVLENYTDISHYDAIKVDITTAYEIGIARDRDRFIFSNSIEEWRKQVYPIGSTNDFVSFAIAKALALP
jgi:uncharacterized RDD family membrane protein YckC